MALKIDSRFSLKCPPVASNSNRADEFFEEDEFGPELVGVLCTPVPSRPHPGKSSKSQVHGLPVQDRSSSVLRISSSAVSPAENVHSNSSANAEKRARRNTTRGMGTQQKKALRVKGVALSDLPVLQSIREDESNSVPKTPDKEQRDETTSAHSDHKGWRLGETVLPVESSQSGEDDDDIFSENFFEKKPGRTCGNVQNNSEGASKAKSGTTEANCAEKRFERQDEDIACNEETVEALEEEIPCASNVSVASAASNGSANSEPPTLPRPTRPASINENDFEVSAARTFDYDLIPETNSEEEEDGDVDAARLNVAFNAENNQRAKDVNLPDEVARDEYNSALVGAESVRFEPTVDDVDQVASTLPSSTLSLPSNTPSHVQQQGKEPADDGQQQEKEQAVERFQVPVERFQVPEGVQGFVTGRGKTVRISESGRQRAEQVLAELLGRSGTQAPSQAVHMSPSKESAEQSTPEEGVPVVQLPPSSQLESAAKPPSLRLAEAREGATDSGSERRAPVQTCEDTRGEAMAFCDNTQDERAPHQTVQASILDRKRERGHEDEGGTARPDAPQFGFCSGRGKSIKLSEAGLKRAEQLLGDFTTSEDHQPYVQGAEPPAVSDMIDQNLHAMPTKGDGSLAVSPECTSNAEAMRGYAEAESLASFSAQHEAVPDVGFTTGRGRKVQFSDEAVQKAELLFKGIAGNEHGECDSPLEKSGPGARETQNVSGSFSTGRGRAVALSESAVRSAEDLLEAGPVTRGEPVTPASFSTGRGKAFHVPASAMRKAEHLLADDVAPGAKHGKPPASEEMARQRGYSTPDARTATASQGLSDATLSGRSTQPPGSLHTPASKRSAESAGAPSSSVSKSRRPFKAPRLLSQPSCASAAKPLPQPRYHQAPAPCVTPLQSVQKRTSSVASAGKVTPQLLFSSPESDSQVRAMSKTLNFQGCNSSEDLVERMQRAVPLSLRQAVYGHTPFSDESNGNIEIADYTKIVAVTSANAASFRLSTRGSHFFNAGPDERTDTVGAREMFEMLASSQKNSTDVTEAWVTNHYRWIIWKLAAMERSFPSIFGGNYLTADRAYLQLLNRFDREIVRGLRSTVKQILDRDQVASHPMVLCVSALSHAGEAVHLRLTDGWHEIEASLDSGLTQLAKRNKLFVGQKLRLFGADRDMDEGRPVSIKLAINGTYRAAWDEKLGRARAAPCVGLRCVKSGGGVVPAVRVVVQRVFPLVFMETCADGTKVWRSEGSELKAQQAAEDQINRAWEQHLAKHFDSRELGDAGDAEDSGGPSHAEREKEMQALREEFMGEHEGLVRKVCLVLKMRISCLNPQQLGQAGGDALLTWWRPGESASAIQEGAAFVMHNLQAAEVRRNGLACLSFMRETRCTPVEDVRVSSVFRPRRVAGVEDIGTSSEPELDVCGAVVEVSGVVMDIGRSGRPCRKQHVILTGPSLLDEDAETCAESVPRTSFLRVEVDVDALGPLKLSSSDLPCVLLARNLRKPRLVRETAGMKVYVTQALEEAEVCLSQPPRPRQSSLQTRWASESQVWDNVRAWTERSRDEIMSGDESHLWRLE